MKRVLFVRMAPWFNFKRRHPQDTLIPFDIAYVAAMIDRRRYAIAVIDNWIRDLTVEELVQEILREAPDILGMFVETPAVEVAKEVFNRVAAARPAVKTFAFGQHVTFLPETLLDGKTPVEACVLGEPEMTILELIDTFTEDGALEKVKGIAIWDAAAQAVKRTRPREFMKDLDALPFMDYGFFTSDRYRKISLHVPILGRVKWGFLQSTRGCPYPCTFCSASIRNSYDKPFRARSPQLVVDEMEHLVRMYGVNAIDFCDEVFTWNLERTEAICDEILRRGLRVKWTLTTRADRVERGVLVKMKKAGCASVAIGVESGNDRILRVIKKCETKEEIRKGVQEIHRAGLAINLTFILGHPTETVEEMEETLAFAKELRPLFAQFHLLTPYPGTQVYEDWQAKQGNFSEFFHYGELKYNFSNIPDEVLSRSLRVFYRRYYLSPGYIPVYLRHRGLYALFNPAAELALIRQALAFFFPAAQS